MQHTKSVLLKCLRDAPPTEATMLVPTARYTSAIEATINLKKLELLITFTILPPLFSETVSKLVLE